MSSISIRAKGKKNWFVKPLQCNCELPDSWDDLDGPQLRFCIEQLLKYERDLDAKFHIVHKLLDLPKGVFESLDAQVVCDLIDVLDWMKLETTTTPLIARFQHKGIHYFLPLAKFKNGVAIEYPIADDYLVKFIKEGKMSDLNLLIATICRPDREDHKKSISKGDRRIPLLSRMEVEERAKVLADLPEHIKISVLLYFAGIKNYIFEIYKGHIFPDNKMIDIDGTEIEVDPDENNKALLFGWWSKYFEIAETGVFGNLKKVHQTNFHTLCMYLVEKKRAEERTPKPKTNE